MKKVWLDTDPGVDDTVAMAMLFAASEELAVIGVSTVFGNVGVEDTTRNAKLLLEAAGLKHLPVARGASGPLGVPFEIGGFVHGDNGLGNMTLPEATMKESPLSAPQAIIDVIRKHPHEITLLPIGPLTNIALAYLLAPEIADLVKEVVIMGGAVLCPGNVTPAAEANFYHDPHAAKIVMRAGWPIALAGLDVIDDGMISKELLDRICAADKPLTKYIAGSVPFFQKFLESTGMVGQVYFPDALAAAYLIDSGIFTVEEIPLFIETEGACKGQSVPVRRGNWFEEIGDARSAAADSNVAPAQVMLQADTEKFLKLMERLLT